MIQFIAGSCHSLHIADRRFEMAQTPSADVQDASSFGKTVGTVKRFGELGMTGELPILGTDTMYLGFDASQFGVGPIDSAEVNLRARYTPIDQGEGSVVVRAGSAVVGTWPLDRSGDLDITFRVPADAIQSNVGLALDIRYLPHRGNAPGNHITFIIQPESTVEVSPGTQTRRGFSVLPMAFSPAFNVAVDEPDKIRFAAADKVRQVRVAAGKLFDGQRRVGHATRSCCRVASSPASAVSPTGLNG